MNLAIYYGVSRRKYLNWTGEPYIADLGTKRKFVVSSASSSIHPPPSSPFRLVSERKIHVPIFMKMQARI
jgi:hypothetical protein